MCSCYTTTGTAAAAAVAGIADATTTASTTSTAAAATTTTTVAAAAVTTAASADDDNDTTTTTSSSPSSSSTYTPIPVGWPSRVDNGTQQEGRQLFGQLLLRQAIAAECLDAVLLPYVRVGDFWGGEGHMTEGDEFLLLLLSSFCHPLGGPGLHHGGPSLDVAWEVVPDSAAVVHLAVLRYPLYPSYLYNIKQYNIWNISLWYKDFGRKTSAQCPRGEAEQTPGPEFMKGLQDIGTTKPIVPIAMG